MSGATLINRDLSWLEFNRRVLEEAEDPHVPLLERLKFLSIVSSNLDEFFMVRVAELKRRIAACDETRGPDGLTAAEVMRAVAERAGQLSDEQHRCFLDGLQPLLEGEGIRILAAKDLDDDQARHLRDYFRRSVLPVITPLAIDAAHPFPHLSNRGLCLLVGLRAEASGGLPAATRALVHIPSTVLPRFVALPSARDTHAFILLEDVIRAHLPDLYQEYEIGSAHAIRVTRDADLQLSAATGPDLLTNIERSLQERRMGAAVRLQYEAGTPPALLALLVEELELSGSDLYEADGFIAFADLMQLYAAVDRPHLKYRPRVAHPVTALATGDVWSAIRARDVLVHHPYQSFDAVTRFVQDAATDPAVLAIKMTLYRVSPSSPITQALTKAAESGKEVAALIELQARFDEEANIRWARALEDVGAHVVYGLAGFKTHCKACLVVRQDADGLRRYCHLATGNYNARTAGIYSDLGLFTARDDFGDDVTELFNLLTGYARPGPLRQLIMAPTGLRSGLAARIRREAEHARAGRPAGMIVKVNSLVDPELIEELYAASQAGVTIDLIVRGICCLRPGVPGLSDRIRAISIIDRYLEHARVVYFENGGTPECWLASADWMPRNLDRRVEIAFPLIDPALRADVREILAVQLGDRVKGRILQPDGRSHRLAATDADDTASQDRLHQLVDAR